MVRGTNLPRVGGYNRAVVVDAIRARGPVSRVELAAATGLTSATVGNIVRRLIDEGLVHENGLGESRGGKRRVLLEMRARSSFAVGLSLDPQSCVCVLVDLTGAVLARTRRRIRSPARPAPLLSTLSAAVSHVVVRSGVERSRVLGIGVGVPGPVDDERGIVVDPPNLAAWQDVALTRVLEERTGLPALLAKDATAAAIGERWLGGQERAEPFAYVYVGTGIGGGLVLADGAWAGRSGNAGEFGHVSVVPGGRRCGCGDTGCVEAHCSPHAIARAYAEAVGHGAATRLGLTLDAQRALDDQALVVRAAHAGDGAAARVLAEVVRLLTDAAVTLVNLTDVGLVVLGGEGLRGLEDAVRASMARGVNTRTLARSVRVVRVVPSLLGSDAAAVGAASLVLHGRFSPGWDQLHA